MHWKILVDILIMSVLLSTLLLRIGRQHKGYVLVLLFKIGGIYNCFNTMRFRMMKIEKEDGDNLINIDSPLKSMNTIIKSTVLKVKLSKSLS